MPPSPPTSFQSQNLEGRIALITGGSQGIGKEVARGLARAGVTVLIAARNAATGEATARELAGDGKVIFCVFDVNDEAALQPLVALVDKQFGKLDILVNNAALGGRGMHGAFEVSADEMREVYASNVFAVVSMVQAFLPLLTKSKAGRIVNVSSERGSLTEGTVSEEQRAKGKNNSEPGTMAHRVAFITQPNMAYSSSKTALNALTQHFAYQLEKMGSAIKINAAAPGHCATAFNNFRGSRTPAEGARIIVTLALLDERGPSGGFFKDDGQPESAPW
jgi:NAD(P)-dependent dehydrogenase (short-subunit alcohol dehydrogenase family)